MEPIKNYLDTNGAVEIAAVDLMREAKNTLIAATAHLSSTLNKQSEINEELSAMLKDSTEASNGLSKSLETVDLSGDITEGLQTVANEVASVKNMLVAAVKNSMEKSEKMDKDSRQAVKNSVEAVQEATEAFRQLSLNVVQTLAGGREVTIPDTLTNPIVSYRDGRVQKVDFATAVMIVGKDGKVIDSFGGGGGAPAAVSVTTYDTELLPSVITTDSGTSTINGYVKTAWDDQGNQTSQTFYDSEFNAVGATFARPLPQSKGFGFVLNGSFASHVMNTGNFGSQYYNSVIIENLAFKVEGGNLSTYRRSVEQEIVLKVTVETEENGNVYTNVYAASNGVNKYDVVGRYIKSVMVEAYGSFGSDIENNGGLVELESGALSLGQPSDNVYGIVRLERI
jgi:hypothetical protein